MEVWIRSLQPLYDETVGQIEIPVIHWYGPYTSTREAGEAIADMCGVSKGGTIPEDTYEIIVME